MKTFTTNKSVDRWRLMTELMSAGFDMRGVVEGLPGETVITVSDTETKDPTAIITAHSFDPAADPVTRIKTARESVPAAVQSSPIGQLVKELALRLGAKL